MITFIVRLFYGILPHNALRLFPEHVPGETPHGDGGCPIDPQMGKVCRMTLEGVMCGWGFAQPSTRGGRRYA